MSAYLEPEDRTYTRVYRERTPDSNNAVKAGATQGELAEAAWVAAALRAGASYAHGRVAFKLTDPTHAH